MAKRAPHKKDAAFQQMLSGIVESTPAVPSWPFKTVTSDDWDEMPERVKERLDKIIADFVRMAREERGC